jgi:hypothetical protein
MLRQEEEISLVITFLKTGHSNISGALNSVR